MSEPNKPFVITDRRKFNLDGEPRPDADPSPVRERPSPEPAAPPAPIAVAPQRPADGPEAPAQAAPPAAASGPGEPQGDMPPPPTGEEMDQSKRAYEQTADRLDTAIRAANPGMEHPPAMSFEQLVQSVYMSSIMQLGGATPEGQKPQVDIMGARQSIDMLGVISEKTKGNLSQDEQRLLDSALFELRLAFLEITQALARSAQAKPAPAGRPSIVR